MSVSRHHIAIYSVDLQGRIIIIKKVLDSFSTVVYKKYPQFVYKCICAHVHALAIVPALAINKGVDFDDNCTSDLNS